jgi:hypothetical protein
VPSADRAKATLKVRIGIHTRDARILPEMGVRVSILDGDPAERPAPGALGKALSHAGAVTVPPQAVRKAASDAADSGLVFVEHNGVLEGRRVRLGAADSEAQVVVAGLSPGERVATGQLAALADGMHVRVTGP